jgi:hypothetical protein
VVVDDDDPFGRYLAEILRCEGFAAFGVADRSDLAETTLSTCDVLVLAPMRLRPDQASLLGRWVEAGGALVALRPDPSLHAILGLRATEAKRDGYVCIVTSTAPGRGLCELPLRIHGPVDGYVVDDAVAVAGWGPTPTSSEAVAVTVRGVGERGGRAVAFAFDLARSVVLSRQGNPTWARSGRPGPTRAIDLFRDPSDPDRLAWVDPELIGVPHADELQRLFANLIVHLGGARRPVPRFWYFPDGAPAVVVLTGDDHGKADVPARFERLRALGAARGAGRAGGSVRATAYLWPDTPRRDAHPQMTASQAAAYAAEGFEVALHANAGRDDHRPEVLAYHLDRSLRAWRSRYPDLPEPVTLRWHCVAWSGWIEPAVLELLHGIRLDLTSYYYPAELVEDRPGFFTGSAMPMRFADPDGRRIDVFQLCTQLTDESGQRYPETIEALLDAALGPGGFFGALAANVHTGLEGGGAIAEHIVKAALAHGVPVMPARRLLEWVDAREASNCEVTGWDGRTLELSVHVAPRAAGSLILHLPADAADRPIAGLVREGSEVPFRRVTVKGLEYAAFPAETGTYVATFGAERAAHGLDVKEEAAP